jgi:hypothetical protein
MRWIKMLLLCSLLAGCGKGSPDAPRQRLDRAMARLAAADMPEKRFYALGDAAKESFVAGKTGDAQKYAQELLQMLPNYRDNREYGSALHDANMVLGRIAVLDGKTEDAKRYLLAAGATPGTPQMMTYGPNMSLANDLLAKGERQPVLEYFDLCRRFWIGNDGRLDKWSEAVKAGKVPDFGPSLSY